MEENNKKLDSENLDQTAGGDETPYPYPYPDPNNRPCPGRMPEAPKCPKCGSEHYITSFSPGPYNSVIFTTTCRDCGFSTTTSRTKQ